MMGWVPVTGPLGLGLSIVSYAAQLSVGLASDAHLLPDHDRLLALLDDEIGALHTPTASSSPPGQGTDIRPRRRRSPRSSRSCLTAASDAERAEQDDLSQETR